MSDEAFSERVKKTFGNLFASISPAPTPSSLSNPLWSLTGGEVERREWRREQDTSRDNNPCASSFDDFVSCARKHSRENLKNYKKELDDDMQDLDRGGGGGDEEDDGVEKAGLVDWDLRGSIGLDSTLDNEEEEDTYDKVAIGRENAGDRYYTSDILGSNNSNSVSKNDLFCGIGGRRRDPRANWSAARIRLKEDDAEAAVGAEQDKCPPAPCTSSRKEKSVSSVAVGDKVKPILKRKEHDRTSKPSKRVRFDPGCVGDGSASEVKENLSDDNPSEVATQVKESLLDDKVRPVPDYVRNPCKYTRYSLDSADEMNNKSNSGAYVEFLHKVKELDNTGTISKQDDAASVLPNSITFVPKKNPGPGKSDGVDSELTGVKEGEMKPSSMESTVVSGFAAEEVLETEVGDMDVDEPDRGTNFRKQDRHYRTKSQADEPE